MAASTPSRIAGKAEKKTGTDQYAAFMGRLLRSFGRKATEGELDTTALTQLVELRELLDAQTAETVAALRAAPDAPSWEQIGSALGITRAAAYKRYGVGEQAGVRKPGGQPAHLR